jgi:hypothetical protein
MNSFKDSPEPHPKVLFRSIMMEKLGVVAIFLGSEAIEVIEHDVESTRGFGLWRHLEQRGEES